VTPVPFRHTAGPTLEKKAASYLQKAATAVVVDLQSTAALTLEVKV
jgi:hypothetical protein